MTKKRGLGQGLAALISKSTSSALETGLIEVALDHIIPNPYQPRQVMDQVKLQELADSILKHGLIQPLIVTKIDDSHYQLIAGERRWRASQIAGLETVPVVVKEATPQSMLELALIENIQRADLNPLEEAVAYQQLIHEFHLTQESVAEQVGKSRTTVTNILRLLQLPPEVKDALMSNQISEGHARALLGLKNQPDQLELLQAIQAQQLTVRQTENLVRQYLGSPNPVKKFSPAQLTPHDRNLVSRFEATFGTKVELVRTEADQGRLVIHFFSQEDLQVIFERILGQEEAL